MAEGNAFPAPTIQSDPTATYQPYASPTAHDAYCRGSGVAYSASPFCSEFYTIHHTQHTSYFSFMVTWPLFSTRPPMLSLLARFEDFTCLCDLFVCFKAPALWLCSMFVVVVWERVGSGIPQIGPIWTWIFLKIVKYALCTREHVFKMDGVGERVCSKASYDRKRCACSGMSFCLLFTVVCSTNPSCLEWL